jgi:hypothetical protein
MKGSVFCQHITSGNLQLLCNATTNESLTFERIASCTLGIRIGHRQHLE